MTSKRGKNQKSGTRGDSRVSHWCSYHILMLSVIYYWTDARPVTWNPFVLYNKRTVKLLQKKLFYFKIFQHNSKTGLCPCTLVNTKIAIWRDLLSMQNEAISLVAVCSRELWLVHENHATVKLDSSVTSRGMKTYSETQNWIAKSTNFEENAGKIITDFVVRAALRDEKIVRCLEYCRSWKNTLGNLQ